MLQEEFEDRIGRKVTTEEYTNANALYMASSIDKDIFCQEYESIKDSQTVSMLYEQLDYEKSMKEYLKQKMQETAAILIRQNANTGVEQLREQAIRLLGKKQYILLKIKLGIGFDTKDHELVKQALEEQER